MVDVVETREMFDALMTNKLSNEDFEKLFNLVSNICEIEDKYAYALKIASIYSASKNKNEQIEYDKNVYEQMYRDYIQKFYSSKDDPADDKPKAVIVYDIDK
jgi:hypothetical protein